jgi:hypothetical protein
MSGEALKEKARALQIDPQSRHAMLQKLILDGFFDAPVSSQTVVLGIKERFGKRVRISHIQTYMRKFMQAEVIRAVKPAGHRGNYWVLASVERDPALRLIGKQEKVLEIEDQLFSEKVLKNLRKDFGQELKELESNFGKHGNCTAFLLRKILEKLIIIVLSKHGKASLLEDKARLGGWVGLKDMIEIAAREKLNGVPFLVPKTANEIKGIKFLGDTAAHNPLVGVNNETILPQMPYIITAYEELGERL